MWDGKTSNATELYYRLKCPFHNSHDCKWTCRLRIPAEDHAANLVGVAVDRRAEYHAHHVIYIETSGHQHSNHKAFQAKGAHMTFQCAAEYNPKMYSWSRKEVRLWLEEEGIDCGQGGQKNQMHERITQHCNHKRKVMMNSTVGMQGRSTAWGVLTLFVSQMSLAQRQKEPGFTVDTAYLVPGSRLDSEGRGCCLLLTTVNHILNLARMCQWHAPSKPTAGVDHTHKVKLI